MKWLCEEGRGRGRETEASLQVVGNISYIYLRQSVVIALIAIHYSDSATACFKLIIIYAIYDMCMCVCVCVTTLPLRADKMLSKISAGYVLVDFARDFDILSAQTARGQRRSHGRWVGGRGRHERGWGLVWNTTKYTNKARNEYYATLAETDTVADGVLTPSPQPLPPWHVPTLQQIQIQILVINNETAHLLCACLCVSLVYLFCIYLHSLPLSLSLAHANSR